MSASKAAILENFSERTLPPSAAEAALAADCKLLFLPGENRDDLPPELKEQADAQGMEILFADTLAEIWAKCMEL